MNPSGYLLDFVIPQVPTGPKGENGVAGPTGNADNNAAIGYINNYQEVNSTFLRSYNPLTLDLNL
jgi:hypothetical protein